MSLESRIEILKDRSQMLAASREYFSKKNILEVDCPALSIGAPIDRHIDVMAVTLPSGEKRFLHTSPEYRMKRLLSEGFPSMYQISHVYRESEHGHLHNPEFSMVEWYEIGITFDELIESTLQYVHIFLGTIPCRTFTYRQLWKEYFSIDYVHATCEDLVALCVKHDLTHPEMNSWDKDTLLQFAMSFLIEPHIGKNELFVIKDYPGSQAALAKSELRQDEKIAKRFEVYYQGIELANGYHELTDGLEQEKRLQEENKARTKLGKNPLPIDNFFLEAIQKGIGDCCGVAVGFDRLMLLRHKKDAIYKVIPFAWENA